MNIPTERIPSSYTALKTLLRADLTVQWRQRRSMVMSMLMPIIFLISWKSLIPVAGVANVLSICLAIGLPATGLMGYSLTIARDRERGVFQRLRAAPVSTRVIMASRLLVQLIVIAATAVLTLIAARVFDGIHVSVVSGVFIVLASLVGGMSFLAIGQLLVAFIQGTEAVSSAARLLYFPLAIVGALGEIGLFGDLISKIVTWSPFGTTKTLLAAAISLHAGLDVWLALLVTLLYAFVFAGIGIRYFRWTVG